MKQNIFHKIGDKWTGFKEWWDEAGRFVVGGTSAVTLFMVFLIFMGYLIGTKEVHESYYKLAQDGKLHLLKEAAEEDQAPHKAHHALRKALD